METTFLVKKEPIVNGSINKTLTVEEAKQFDYETKKRMCWYFVVGINYHHSFNDVNDAVFFQTNELPTYEDIKSCSENEIDEVLEYLMDIYNHKYQALKTSNRENGIAKGREIRKQQSLLGFGGFLKMDYTRLIGYVLEEGGWNEKEPQAVCDMIEKLEEAAPRMNYGVNNPNTGGKKHYWTTTGEYITLCYDYVSEKEMEEIMKFYNLFEVLARNCNADSIRNEITEHPHKHFGIELIMWWD